MRYKPVYAAQITRFSGTGSMTRKQMLEAAVAGQGYSFWTARGGKLVGDCGHEHATQEETLPCVERLQKEWHKRRSELSREAARKRKLKNACDAMSKTMPVMTTLLRMANGL